MDNPVCVLEKIEDDLKLSSKDIWGFDLKGKYSYFMSDEDLYPILDGVDFFHLQALVDFSRIVKENKSIKFSSILYDVTPFLVPEYANESLVKWFNEKYIPSIKLYDKIISISRHGLVDLLDYQFVNNSQKLTFLQLPNYDIDREKLNQCGQIDLLENKKYFVVVGSIEPRKNIKKLIEGFKLYLNRFPDFYLTFVGGSGWKNDDIYQSVFNDPVLKKHILLTGYLGDTQMLKVIESSMGLCMISNYEGFGLPLALANSLGVPTMSNWGSSLPEASDYDSVYINSWDEYNIAYGFSCLKERAKKKPLDQIYNWQKYCEKLVEIIVS
jgi:glycosyltransferase involved in cell wall biosynthesis